MFPGNGKQVHRLKFADVSQKTDTKALLVESAPAANRVISGVLVLTGAIQAVCALRLPCTYVLLTPKPGATLNPFYWGGPAAAQTAHATFGTYDPATKRSITIVVPKRADGTESVTISATDSGGTLTAALAALAALCAASTDPVFAAITWTSNATQIIATNKVNGLPMVFSAAVAGGTGTLGADYTVDTSSAGPAVPIAIDDLKGECVPCSDASQVYVKGTAADSINYTILAL